MKDISVVLKGAAAGGRKAVGIAEEMLRKEIDRWGGEHAVSFPDTA